MPGQRPFCCLSIIDPGKVTHIHVDMVMRDTAYDAVHVYHDIDTDHVFVIKHTCNVFYTFNILVNS